MENKTINKIMELSKDELEFIRLAVSTNINIMIEDEWPVEKIRFGNELLNKIQQELEGLSIVKIENFKEMVYNHVILCKRILEANGSCDHIECALCPFSPENSTASRGCKIYGEDSKIFKKNVKRFIDLYEENYCKEMGE